MIASVDGVAADVSVGKQVNLNLPEIYQHTSWGRFTFTFLPTVNRSAVRPARLYTFVKTLAFHKAIEVASQNFARYSKEGMTVFFFFAVLPADLAQVSAFLASPAAMTGSIRSLSS